MTVATLAILVWIVVALVLARVVVIHVLALPHFPGQALMLIPVVAIIGYIVAAPISFVIARAIVRAAA